MLRCCRAVFTAGLLLIMVQSLMGAEPTEGLPAESAWPSEEQVEGLSEGPSEKSSMKPPETQDGLFISVPDTSNQQAVSPRSIQMTVFRVENRTESVQTVQAEIRLPEGWEVLMPVSPLTIEPGEQKNIFLSYQVPQGALGGENSIVCVVETHDGSIRSAEQRVFVESSYGLHVELVRKPVYAESNTSYELTFLIKNESNVEADVLAEVESSEEIELKTDLPDGVLSLQPQESRTVTLAIPAWEDDVIESFVHAVELQAEIVDQDTAATAESEVEIIPANPGGNPWHTYPLSINWSTTVHPASELPLVNSVSISGSGTYNDQGDYRLNFSLNPPAFPSSGFSLNDTRFSFSFEHEDAVIYGGEHSFSISGLPSEDVKGFGLGLKYDFDVLQAETYYAEAEANIFSDADMSDGADFGFGLLKEFSGGRIAAGFSAKDNAFSRGKIGVSGAFRPYNTASIGFSAAAQAENLDAYMYSLSASETVDTYAYAVSRTYQSPGYAESTYGSDQYRISGSLKAIPRLKISGLITRSMNNLSLNSAYDTAMNTQTINLSADWNPARRLSIDAEQEFYRQWDLLESSPFELQKDKSSISIGLNWSKFSLSSYTDVYHTLISGEDRKQRSFISGMRANYTVNQEVRLTSQVSFDSGLNETGLADSSLDLNAEVSYKPDAPFTLYGSYFSRLNPYSDRIDYGVLQIGGNVKHEQLGNFSANFSHTHEYGVSSDPQVSFTISYSKPLTINIPVTLRSDVGTVMGRVTDADTGEGIPDARLSIGKLTTISKEDGTYTFPAVNEGEVKMNLTVPQLETGYVVNGEYPAELTVKGSEETVCDVAMVRSAAVEGRLIRMEEKNSGSLFTQEREYEERGGFGGIIVQLEGEYKVRREVTRGDGSFSFKNFVPGDMTLTIFDNNLPVSHELSRETYELSLESGETEQLEIEILPVRRNIKFMEEEVIELQ